MVDRTPTRQRVNVTTSKTTARKIAAKGISYLFGMTLMLVSLAAPVQADEYYSKFGFWQHDVENYKMQSASIPVCATVLRENYDRDHPQVSQLPHFARLYASCRRELEKRHASLGVLRVNDLWLGITCIGVAMALPSNDTMPECNLKPYIPKP